MTILSFFGFLEFLSGVLWGYVDFLIILTVGIYLTVKSNFFQFKIAIHPCKVFKNLLSVTSKEKKHGINPLRLYLTSIGGAIGIGNVGSIVTAVALGGPGGLFWMWIAVFFGMLVKYAEVFLGIKHRVANNSGSYDGGAMYYLAAAFKSKTVPIIFCVLMCIYGVEIYQFKVAEDAIVETFGLNKYFVMSALLFLTLYVTLGGINRLSFICSILMPIFLVTYIFAALYVICKNAAVLPTLMADVIKSAFTGHAAVGGFLGSTIFTAVQYGMSSSVYSGDIGIGYDSVIQSETQLLDPRIQAKAVIFTLITDCFICSLSVLLVLVTGQWCSSLHHGFDLIVSSLCDSIPCVKQIMAIFFFLAGWTTVLGYLAVGVKSAKFLNQQKGPVLFIVYAVFSFIMFSFIDQDYARLVMYVAGALLVLTNVIGIFKLRKEIYFDRTSGIIDSETLREEDIAIADDKKK
jgi:AGCS family alanine or glycine:cation symporter